MAGTSGTEQPRSGKGRFVRDIATAERDAECARLRAQNMKYRDIATQLGIDVKTAYEGVHRAIRDAVIVDGTAARDAELERIATDNARLDDLEMVVIGILEAQHITVSNGRVIYVGDVPLVDNGAALAAIDRLLKIGDSRRRNGERVDRLMGLNAAQKVNLTGGVTYEIIGLDSSDPV